VPDGFGCDSIAPKSYPAAYSSEDRTTINASRRNPLIDGAFRPYRNGNGSDVFSFADQVGNHRVLLANLEIFRSESNQFCPPQATSDEQRQNRPITFASEAV
jgi:hypothetical protein